MNATHKVNPGGRATLVRRPPLMLATPGWQDYALVDLGGGAKLERYGRYTIVRPEEQAMGSPHLPATDWEKADARFVGIGDDETAGRWRYRKPLPETWPMAYGGVSFLGRFTNFRHVGVFPEQVSHWQWIEAEIARARRPLRILNLFAYTGIVSLLAARLGAEVVHIDASKKAIAWARDNQALSQLTEAKIRWITDDATKFAEREVRRGSRYDGIILDPPKFGRGPNGEVWDIYANLKPLLEACRTLLSDNAAFLILTAYSIRSSFAAIDELAAEVLAGMGGTLESGELMLREQNDGRLLSTSLYSRWSR